MAHLGPFERVDQTGLCRRWVGEANDADGDALCRAQFVHLKKVERYRGSARFEPCLSILARHQVYDTIIRSNTDDLPDEEEEEKE